MRFRHFQRHRLLFFNPLPELANLKTIQERPPPLGPRFSFWIVGALWMLLHHSEWKENVEAANNWRVKPIEKNPRILSA